MITLKKSCYDIVSSKHNKIKVKDGFYKQLYFIKLYTQTCTICTMHYRNMSNVEIWVYRFQSIISQKDLSDLTRGHP